MNATLQVMPRYDGEEIDLFELFQVLWLRKWFIVLCCVVCVSVAGGGAYFSSGAPVYKVAATVSGVSPESFSSFIRVNGDDKAVFEQLVQMSGLAFDRAKSAFTNIDYLDEYSEVIGVRLKPAVNRGNVVSLMFSDQKKAAKFLDGYLEFVSVKLKESYIGEINRQRGIKKEVIQNRINVIRDNELQRVRDEVVRLESALIIARKARVERPVPSGNYMREPYLLGSLLLEAKLDVLESRESHDAYISGLRQLQVERQSILLLAGDALPGFKIFDVVSPAQILGIQKPKLNVKLMMFLGAVLGLLLSVAGVLLHHSIQRRQQALKQPLVT